MQLLAKKTFLCVRNYDEGYFDFHCLPEGKTPGDGVVWYTICGTNYPNHLEYIVVVSAFSFIGIFAYINILAWSGKQPLAIQRLDMKQKKH